MSSLDQEESLSSQERENVQHEREAMLVVAGLITASTFQGVLQPPRGFDDKTGISNMDNVQFFLFFIFNTMGFTASMLYIAQLIGDFKPHFMFLASFCAITATYSIALTAISGDSRRWVGCFPFVCWVGLFGVQYFRRRYKNK